MNVNAMHHSSARSSATSPASLILLALRTGTVAALVAGVLAGHVPELLIVVGVIVSASIFSWHRVQMTPARVGSQHQFTVVSRCGDGFVTIDSSGARHVARPLVLGNHTS